MQDDEQFTTSTCHDISLFKTMLKKSRREFDDKLNLKLNSIRTIDELNKLESQSNELTSGRIEKIQKCIQILKKEIQEKTSIASSINYLQSNLQMELEVENILKTSKSNLFWKVKKEKMKIF